MAPHFNEHPPYDLSTSESDQDDPREYDPPERLIRRAFRREAREQRAREEQERQQRALDPDAEEDEEDYEEAARLAGGRTPRQGKPPPSTALLSNNRPSPELETLLLERFACPMECLRAQE